MSRSDLCLEVSLRQQGSVPLEVDFEVGAGELMALVGPSGSGKTTVLRMIAGLQSPEQGRICIGKQCWYDSEQALTLPVQQRRVGMMFQDYALFPHLDASANVSQALGHVPAGERHVRAAELLARVHLQGLEQRRPAQLSGGQRQRVALARALAREPRVLLLDEPFSSVDQVTRRKLQQELARLRGQIGIPMVLVTHDLNEARMLADRMVVLHHGKTLQCGKPEEVINHPQSVHVARLMDQANLFTATVREHRPELGRSVIDWHGRLIETPLQQQLNPGQQVDWLVPGRSIVMHRRDRPSNGERENPVDGVVAGRTDLGDQVQIRMQLTHAPNASLEFSLPAHVAERNGLAEGGAVSVSLLSEGLHLMPGQNEGA